MSEHNDKQIEHWRALAEKELKGRDPDELAGFTNGPYSQNIGFTFF